MEFYTYKGISAGKYVEGEIEALNPPSPHTPLAPCRPPARHRTRPSRSPAATHRYALTALTLCLPSDTGRDAHPCRCASVCRAERSSMPTPGGAGEPTPPVPGALSAPRAEPRIGEGRPWVPH